VFFLICSARLALVLGHPRLPSNSHLRNTNVHTFLSQIRHQYNYEEFVWLSRAPESAFEQAQSRVFMEGLLRLAMELVHEAGCRSSGWIWQGSKIDLLVSACSGT
jgi:hypothetical protein